MTILRRRLASCALAVCGLQLLVLLGAPVSACCEATTAVSRAASGDECCPAGTHGPGQCPMHKNEARDQRAEARGQGGCRVTCSHQGPTVLLIAPLGTLPPAATFHLTFVSRTLAALPAAALLFHPSNPFSPPPERR